MEIIASWSGEHFPAFNLDQKAAWELGGATTTRTTTTPTDLVPYPHQGFRHDRKISRCRRWWQRRGKIFRCHPRPRPWRRRQGLNGGMDKGGGQCRIIGISVDLPVISASRFSVYWSRSQGERPEQPNTHRNGSPSRTIQGYLLMLSQCTCDISIFSCHREYAKNSDMWHREYVKNVKNTDCGM